MEKNIYIIKFINLPGIVINNCPTYVHELNGTAERYNGTVMDMARCLLPEAQVHKKYWPEIVCTATYLKNRILANTVERKTPNVGNLRLYGSKVIVRRTEKKRVSKWDKKADMGILLGYSEVGYRVLLGGKITVARHVEVIETDTKCIGSVKNSFDEDNDDIEDNDLLESTNKENLENREDESDSGSENFKIPRRSTRNRRVPVRYPETEDSSEIHVICCRVDPPCTFEEAICGENREN